MKKQPPNKKRTALKRVPPEQPRKKKPSEVEQPNRPLLKRVIFGEEKPDLTELEAGSTTILDILSPTTVDTKSKDYIVVDGVYHAYLYVTGYGYSTTVGSCWLAPLVEAGEGINMSFLVKRQSKEKILSKISQTTMMNRSRMREVGDTRQDYEELDSAISSGLYLKDVMNRQGEDFYYMHTLIEVTAPDPETLEQRATEVEKLCVSVDMIARRCDYKNEQAFLSSLPILSLDSDIERKARRNALTSGVAAAFPFASYELSDHNGIFLGLNLYNRSPVFLDPYDDYKYTNGNWWIGGSTGAGKTVTLQCLGGRLRQQGKRVIIIAPKTLIGIFSSDATLMKDAVPALKQYFAAFICMDMQYIGQTVFKSLNKKKQAIFFSLLRKVFIVVPLTYLMPYALHMGTDGVFLAEPVSNVIGGGLCFITMLLTVLPELKRMERKNALYETGTIL